MKSNIDKEQHEIRESMIILRIQKASICLHKRKLNKKKAG